jgi:predicted NBD/HSP70 family sugar kinase
MTENEKRILTLLSKEGSLSKKELAQKGGMGWATVVKMVSRLEEAGIIHCVGTDSQPETSGKNPAVYELTGEKPLAIGIDVSYSETNIILTNLKNTILEQYTCKTPQLPDEPQLKEFLVSRYSEFTAHVLPKRDCLAGIGIGIPRWLVKNGVKTFSSLAAELEIQLQTQVRIEECTARNYAMFKKWVGDAFPLNDFILMTIRNGVGAGVFYQGHLVRGTHGMAGELGHLSIVDYGNLCRCGKYGCLETLVNQDILYRDYVKRIRNEEYPSPPPLTDSTEIHEGLTDLFSLAQQGHREASGIIEEAATHIGMGVAALLMVLDIPNVIITGHFGLNGTAMIPYIKREVSRRIISGIDYSVEYYPLDRLGFAYGAALLILNDYFTGLGM